jgi:nitroimidazol reductase NimA-like FMN-containing flavoprotein (pyridoxamine 5'-phosphate oxidase superfamily)
MAQRTPTTTLDPDFSSPDASAVNWTQGQGELEAAQIYWVATVRPDGRPHVVPLLSVWLDGALYFCTGTTERKVKNLAKNPHCIVLTGNNRLNEGLDVVVEGDATTVTDDAKLRRIADAYVAKYGEGWRYTVHDGAFHHGEGHAAGEPGTRVLVYEIVPEKAFGFGRGATFSQTRWRF